MRDPTWCRNEKGKEMEKRDVMETPGKTGEGEYV